MAETPSLVRRLLETDGIARVVPRLPPEVLHRLIDRYGLEACADVVALATPRQLGRVLDIDLWRAPVAGADEAFDPDRFEQWIEMLLQLGPGQACDRLAAMDFDLVVDGLAAHLRVFDTAAVASFMTLDGELVAERAFGTGPAHDVGGYVVECRRPRGWDAILELLAHLQDERPALFHRVMRGCVAVSSGPREAGFHGLLDDRDQHRADLAADREARRDTQGYVAPAPARAFLQAARAIDLEGAPPALDPILRASLRDISPEPLIDDAPAAPADASAATVMEILSDAGVITPPRALIGAGDTEDSRLALVRAFAESHPTALQELAFLANALVSGGAIQGRPFTPQEASDAVVATCNLGLENWPAGWPARNLATAFQVGWAVLHRDLCRAGAAALIAALANLECADRDTQWALQTLRRELMHHLRNDEPWRARDALDAILVLDAPAWAVLRALIDECPAMHAALVAAGRPRLRVDPAAVTFVARNSEIAVAHGYLASLTSALTA
jgi:hypothetical protein